MNDIISNLQSLDEQSMRTKLTIQTEFMDVGVEHTLDDAAPSNQAVGMLPELLSEENVRSH